MTDVNTALYSARSTTPSDSDYSLLIPLSGPTAIELTEPNTIDNAIEFSLPSSVECFPIQVESNEGIRNEGKVSELSRIPTFTTCLQFASDVGGLADYNHEGGRSVPVPTPDPSAAAEPGMTSGTSQGQHGTPQLRPSSFVDTDKEDPGTNLTPSMDAPYDYGSIDDQADVDRMGTSLLLAPLPLQQKPTPKGSPNRDPIPRSHAGLSNSNFKSNGWLSFFADDHNIGTTFYLERSGSSDDRDAGLQRYGSYSGDGRMRHESPLSRMEKEEAPRTLANRGGPCSRSVPGYPHFRIYRGSFDSDTSLDSSVIPPGGMDGTGSSTMRKSSSGHSFSKDLARSGPSDGSMLGSYYRARRTTSWQRTPKGIRIAKPPRQRIGLFRLLNFREQPDYAVPSNRQKHSTKKRRGESRVRRKTKHGVKRRSPGAASRDCKRDASPVRTEPVVPAVSVRNTDCGTNDIKRQEPILHTVPVQASVAFGTKAANGFASFSMSPHADCCFSILDRGIPCLDSESRAHKGHGIPSSPAQMSGTCLNGLQAGRDSGTNGVHQQGNQVAPPRANQSRGLSQGDEGRLCKSSDTVVNSPTEKESGYSTYERRAVIATKSRSAFPASRQTAKANTTPQQQLANGDSLYTRPFTAAFLHSPSRNSDDFLLSNYAMHRLQPLNSGCSGRNEGVSSDDLRLPTQLPLAHSSSQPKLLHLPRHMAATLNTGNMLTPTSRGCCGTPLGQPRASFSPDPLSSETHQLQSVKTFSRTSNGNLPAVHLPPL